MPHESLVIAGALARLLIQLAGLLLRFADYRLKAANGHKKRLPDEQPLTVWNSEYLCHIVKPLNQRTSSTP